MSSHELSCELPCSQVLLHGLRAERRWVLSGTPAKETSDADGCASLGGLLTFLRHPQAREWAAVARRFLRGADGTEVLAFLSPLMSRALKRKIHVPQPIRSTRFLECSAAERLAYNSLVSYVRANLVLTGMRGASEGAGADVSLLHHSNLRSARKAIENIRLASNGGGKQVATLSWAYERECRMWLTDRYRAPAHAVARAAGLMESAQHGVALPCDVCGLPLLLQLVMPLCGHLCCPECVQAEMQRRGCGEAAERPRRPTGMAAAEAEAAGAAAETEAAEEAAEAGDLRACPVCRVALPPVTYKKCPKCDDVECTHKERRTEVTAHPLDAFAYLQPGFDLQWQETLKEAEARALADSYERQRALETRQVGAAGGGGAAARAAAGTRRVSFGAAYGPGSSAMGGDGAGSHDDGSSGAGSSSGGGGAGGGPGGGCGGGLGGEPGAHLTGDVSPAHQSMSHTKAAHVIEAIASLRREERQAEADLAAGRPFAPSPTYDGRPVRVAVYSESRRTLDQLGHFLYLRFGDDAIAQVWWRRLMMTTSGPPHGLLITLMSPCSRLMSPNET